MKASSKVIVHNAHQVIRDRVQNKSAGLYIREDDRNWSLQALIDYAASIQTVSIPDRIKYIGIGLKSPAQTVASMLYAWNAGRVPILFDPESPSDINRLSSLQENVLYIVEPDKMDSTVQHILSFPAVVRTDQTCKFKITIPTDHDHFIGFLTSGSLGEPKLILKQSYQLFRQIEVTPEMFRLSEDCRIVSMVPFYHILGFFYGLMLPLYSGGSIYYTGDMLPTGIRDFLLESRPDFVVGTAVQYRVLESIWEKGQHLGKTLFISSGAPLDHAVALHFQDKVGAQILEMYGSTETGGCAHRYGANTWEPYPTVRFRINPATMHLEVKSPWSENPDQWIVTHDLAEQDRSGFRLLGRDGSLVKIGGKRFSTQEVEQALKQHPSVQDAATLAYERSNKEPALMAFVECEQEEPNLQAELRDFLLAKLAPYKIPRTIQLMTALPRTKLNKINYAALKKEIEK